MPDDPPDAETLRRIGAVVEAHPELSSGESFQHVQAAILDAEDRLALARSFHDDSVTLHNIRRATLPPSLVAGVLGFRTASLNEPAASSTSSATMKSVLTGNRGS